MVVRTNQKTFEWQKSKFTEGKSTLAIASGIGFTGFMWTLVKFDQWIHEPEETVVCLVVKKKKKEKNGIAAYCYVARIFNWYKESKTHFRFKKNRHVLNRWKLRHKSVQIDTFMQTQACRQIWNFQEREGAHSLTWTWMMYYIYSVIQSSLVPTWSGSFV